MALLPLVGRSLISPDCRDWNPGAGSVPCVREDTNDFEDPRLADAIVNDVHWLSDGAGTPLPASMSQVEAKDTREEIVSIPRGRAFWIGCDLSHSRHE